MNKKIILFSRYVGLAMLVWVAAIAYVDAASNSQEISRDSKCYNMTISYSGDGKTTLVPNDNCAAVNSCSKTAGACKVIRGGSQYVYNNKAPACLDQRAQPCVSVECKIVDYLTNDCTGEPINEAINNAKGCRRGVTY